MENDQIKAMIQGHERYMDHIYHDSLGNLTCGWGHHLVVNSKVPRAAAEAFLERDLMTALADYLALVRQYNLTLGPMRRAVLIDMLFNMGLSKVQGFRRMLAALVAEDYDLAADEMEDSRWHNQVGERAVNLEKMMREGEAKCNTLLTGSKKRVHGSVSL